MSQIADAAWRCADPGVQYDTIINRWHTCPESGRINASNPCSEYMHVDDSACNLASLNLMKFRREDGSFDVEDFEHAVDIVFLAQEIIVGNSSYPTEEIGANANAFRQLGLGYANLGALLMSDGLPYDSDEGRNVAAAITALMTGRAYRQSALIAAGDRAPTTSTSATARPTTASCACTATPPTTSTPTGIKGDLLEAAQRAWDEAVELGEAHGYRNAQATVLAPTGTISFLMDCDTTGIEPDFSLVKYKELVGGGQMTIVNSSVPLALRTLGYAEPQVEQIDAHIAENGTIVGAPGLDDEHLPVFDVAVGERAISHTGHIDMMAATQPFISGAISKTVNLPQTATVEDIADAYTRGWKGGLKALAIYRDGSKTAQALRTDAQEEAEGRGGRGADAGAQADAARARVDHPQVLDRRPRGLHHRRQVRGRLGRRDLPHRHRQGGLDDARADQRLRDGDLDRPPVRRPARDFVRKFSYMRFEPEGITQQPGDPVRQIDARLHHALAREPLHRRHRDARGTRDHDPGGPGQAGSGDQRSWPRHRHGDTAGPATAATATRAAGNGAEQAKASAAGGSGGRGADRHAAGRPGEDGRRPTSAPPASSAAA